MAISAESVIYDVMQTLPIDAHIDEILTLARERRRLVLVAPPGSGKTTRVAPALARSGFLTGANRAVLMLQPRRVAARASARRIADENGWILGEEVGYQIRGERRISARTIVRVATEGILTKQIVADPFLEGVGAVILDEFHERSLHCDLALALVREAADSVREDLIVIVMSATLDAGPIAAFLGDCPIVRVDGRAFPVEVEYVSNDAKTPLAERLRSAVCRTIETMPRDRGDILVFLPGVEEIRRAGMALSEIAGRENLLVLPLHGSLPGDEQDRALRPSDRRKVVLATNVAETSLTIDGVTTVIDSGLARFARHDASRGLDRLELGWISRASADQRAGRAGRTAPGRCLRLWPQREDRGRAAFDEAEIRRVDLSSTVLTLKAWGQRDPSAFGWFEPPATESLDAASRILGLLGALDESGAISRIGRELLSLPLPPRLGRLLLAAAGRDRLEDGAALAALLSEKDVMPPAHRRGPDLPQHNIERGRSDLLARLDALNEARSARFSPTLRDRGIDPHAARRVVEVREELIRLGRRLPRDGASREPDDELLLALALLAYPDRVCRRRSEGLATARMVGGRGVRLEPDSRVRDAEFFVAIDPREAPGGGGREARVRIASAIEPAWLSDLFPEAIRRERIVNFDESRGRAVAVETTYYHDLPIREGSPQPVADEEASRALAEWIAPRARDFLLQDPATALWLERLAFLRRSAPGANLPELDDDNLAQAVAMACAGQTTLAALRRVAIVPLLRGMLTYAEARTLDDEAPETIVVPTGNKIRLTYETDRPPTLAVRLQELFGLAETPKVAFGRVPVLLHLLGPNHRPVQVTDDLKSFWNTTYFQVRKDLRNRYPKHSWPEDPWSAQPVAKGRPQR